MTEIRPEDISRLIDEALGAGLIGDMDLRDPRDGFIPTDGARAVIGHLELAAREQFPFALVVGPAGTGKTTVCRYWAAVHESPWIRAKPAYTPSALLEDLAVELRITRSRAFRVLLQMVWDALAVRPRVVFVDEAQLADRPTLETLKYLAETRSTFVLITSEEFAPLIRRHRDIESRIGTIAIMGPISQEELIRLYGGEYPRDTLKEVWALTGGILRDVVRLLRLIQQVAEQNQLPLEAFRPAHVRRVASRLNLAGGAR